MDLPSSGEYWTWASRISIVAPTSPAEVFAVGRPEVPTLHLKECDHGVHHTKVLQIKLHPRPGKLTPEHGQGKPDGVEPCQVTPIQEGQQIIGVLVESWLAGDIFIFDAVDPGGVGRDRHFRVYPDSFHFLRTVRVDLQGTQLDDPVI